MIFGTGETTIFIDNETFGTICIPLCLEAFTLETVIETVPVKYLGEEGVILTRGNQISVEEFILTLTIKDIDYSVFQVALAELSQFTNNNQNQEVFDAQVLGTTIVDPRVITDNTFVFNLTDRIVMEKVTNVADVDAENKYHVDPITNTITFDTSQLNDWVQISAQGSGETLGVIGLESDYEVFPRIGFQGKFFTTTGEGPYILSVPNADLINGPEIKSNGEAVEITYRAVRAEEDQSDRRPFRIYTEQQTGQNVGDETLTASVAFADIPDEWEPGSFLVLAGLVTLETNPDDVLVEDLTFTSTFDFAPPGSENQTITTDPTGAFTVNYTVDPALAFPDAGFLTVVLDDTGDTINQQAISTPAPVPPVFSASLSGGDFEFVEIIVSGIGVAGETVNLVFTNLGGLFNGSSTTVRVDNSWSISDFLPASVIEGTNYTITCSLTGFSDIILNGAVGTRTFNPSLSFSNFYKTGLESTLLGTAQYRSNQEYNLTIESPDLSFYDETQTSDNSGNLTWDFTIPVSEQGKTLTWTFTETSSATVIVLNNTAPQYDINMVFALNSGQGTLIAGVDSITGTIGASEGHNVLITLRDSLSTTVGSQSITNTSGTSSPNIFSISIPSSAIAGNYSIEATSLIHNTSTIDPILPGDATIVEGLTAELESGIVYPTRTIEFSGIGPAGQTIDLNVFGSNFSTSASAINKTWSIQVTVGGGQALGPYTATITTPVLPTEMRTIDFDVVDPILTVDTCPSGLLFTGTQSPPVFGFSGTLRPDKVLTITFVGLGSIDPVVINPNNSGEWQFQLNADWQPRGVYSVTFSSPGETSVICAGSQEGDLTITPENPTFLQGDSSNSVLLRGPENEILNVTVDGVLATNQSLLTNGLGFATLNLPDIDIFTQAPNSGSINVATNSLTNSDSFAYAINERIPITIDLNNPSVNVGGQKILFINTSYTVTGSIPENGVYGFSAIGSANNFALVQVGTPADTYEALLETNSTPGETTLTVSTVFQDPAIEMFVVSPPISFELPSSLIINNFYDLKIFSDVGELVEFQISGDIDGLITIQTGTVGVGGEFVYTFDTTGLSDGQTLTFIISNQYFSFLPQERLLSGFGSGVPEPLVIDVNSNLASIRHRDFEVTGLSLSMDNTPISEAGLATDIISGIIFSWMTPVNDDNFIQYFLESYENGVTGWSLFELTTNNSTIITDFTLSYRITALHGSMIANSQPVYLEAGDLTIFAKDVPNFDINSDVREIVDIVIPEEPNFFSFTTVLPEEEDFISKEVNSDIRIINDIIIPEETTFFIFTTVLPEEEDSISKEVNSDIRIMDDIVIPEETPFFTIP